MMLTKEGGSRQLRNMDNVSTIQSWELADIIRCKSEKVLIVDARTFCEYNTSHIVNSVNVWSSKIRKKRLQQNSISVHDFLRQACHIGLQELKFDEVVVYDQSATFPRLVPPDTFLHVLLHKLSDSFSKVFLLQGGFLEFQTQFYEMCEDSSQKSYLLTSFSQPCLPISNTGATKILPFLFLGSQHDANNKQQLMDHNISYELNVSTSCPKPDFLQDSHFLRIAVNDNFSARLMPHFAETFRFIDKVREVGGRVLVHCLAGISRSPTVVISYVMKYLHMHYDEAYRYVKMRRPTISPNINFVGQLLELDLLLFGDRSFCRSPPGTLYLEPEFSPPCQGSSSPANSLAKSSSSPCIESFDEVDYPFHRNRSLPSLRMQKSLEEMPPRPQTRPSAVRFRRQSSLSPSSDRLCLSSRFSSGSELYASDRLTSTPVFHEHGSAEYSAVLALCVGQTPDDSQRPVWEDRDVPVSGRSLSSVRINEMETGVSPRVVSFSTESANEELVAESSEAENGSSCKIGASGANNDGEGAVSTQDVSSTTQERSSLSTELISPEEPSLRRDKSPKPPHTPTTVLPKGAEKEDPQTKGAVGLNPALSSNSSFKIEDSDRLMPHQLQHSKPFLFPPATATLTSTKEGQFASDSNNNSSPSTQSDVASSFPPKTAGKTSHPCRKTDLPYLPRSHSSSETYLNRRTRLERQAAANPTGANTRKSFSSDEVTRGFQSSCLHPSTPPTTILGPMSAGPHLNKDHPYTMELVRCDSWSTSGLGSEISDWDSIQGDAQSAALLEDAQGPFDAVFSEVFPGEVQSPSGLHEVLPFKKFSDKGLASKNEDKIDLKSSLVSDKKDIGDASQGTNLVSCSKTTVTQVSEDPLVPCPTPRPVSLPGVSGTYNVSDPNANVDMGVGLEESGEWPKDEVKTMAYSPSTARRNHVLFEHPPVNPRTMGENVKYIMTWYKVDSCPQQASSSELPSGDRPTSGPSTEKDIPTMLKKDAPIPPSPPGSPKLRPKVSEGNREKGLDDSLHSRGTPGAADGCLQERWKWWDTKFKEKIRKIQRNVSITSWDSVADDAEELSSDKMAGFHLAKELMQSMEDLLEREIRDIKERASALSSRFGLPVTASLTPPDGGASDPGDVAPISVGLASKSSQDEAWKSDGAIAYGDPHLGLRGRENGLKVGLGLAIPKGRAKSEPPLCMEEGLYRVKSCPGIAQGFGTMKDGIPKKSPMEGEVLSHTCAAFRYPRLFLSRNGNLKRFSCSALDFLSSPVPHFESSCPDVREISEGRRCPSGPFTRESGGSSGSSGSPTASFRRLLKVS